MTKAVPAPPMDPPNTRDGSSYGGYVGHSEQLSGQHLNFKVLLINSNLNLFNLIIGCLAKVTVAETRDRAVDGDENGDYGFWHAIPTVEMCLRYTLCTWLKGNLLAKQVLAPKTKKACKTRKTDTLRASGEGGISIVDSVLVKDKTISERILLKKLAKHSHDQGSTPDTALDVDHA
ncbi:hypothetical protein Tco_0281357 [Tanacetum coccineum]